MTAVLCAGRVVTISDSDSDSDSRVPALPLPLLLVPVSRGPDVNVPVFKFGRVAESGMIFPGRVDIQSGPRVVEDDRWDGLSGVVVKCSGLAVVADSVSIDVCFETLMAASAAVAGYVCLWSWYITGFSI